jgi:hypothetical protein
MNEAVYAVGDTITATIFRLTNAGSNDIPVELKI